MLRYCKPRRTKGRDDASTHCTRECRIASPFLRMGPDLSLFGRRCLDLFQQGGEDVHR